ncbi:MAG: sulfite exporter TauE/SafE family protein [Xanthomonadales bacterium]|nr:sulfite exporter TauE/SafE family protein [Xanthomonadales bacterium]
MPVDLLVMGAALLAGLVGSVHCAAMCGGIATGLGSSQPGLAAALQFNLGRVTGYALAGLLVGLLGAALLRLWQWPTLAVVLRVLLGGVLVLAGLRLLDQRGRMGFLNRPGRALWQRIAPLSRRLLPADRGWKRLLTGMLWGWLPCGLSGTLLSAAWLQGDPLNGALLMAAFGLGTLPMMAPLTWSGARTLRAMQRGWPRRGAALLLVLAGLVTAASPWLLKIPALHGALSALGCQVPG